MGDATYGVRVEKEYFNFSVAHFLIFDAERREELHGHNYRVAVSIEGPLNDEGVVLDFLVLKPIVHAICHEVDHRTVFAENSRHLAISKDGGQVEVRFAGDRFVLPERDVVFLPIENTSTEHLARWVGDRLVSELAERGLMTALRRLVVEVSESFGQSAWCERRFGPADA